MMAHHGIYVWSCVALWAVVVAWNIIPSYRAWAKKMQQGRGSHAT